jgi:hypothetical protein
MNTVREEELPVVLRLEGRLETRAGRSASVRLRIKCPAVQPGSFWKQEGLPGV